MLIHFTVVHFVTHLLLLNLPLNSKTFGIGFITYIVLSLILELPLILLKDISIQLIFLRDSLKLKLLSVQFSLRRNLEVLSFFFLTYKQLLIILPIGPLKKQHLLVNILKLTLKSIFLRTQQQKTVYLQQLKPPIQLT